MIKHSLPLRIFLITFICFALPVLFFFFAAFRAEYRSQLQSNYFSLLENGQYRAEELSQTYLSRITMNHILIETLGLDENDLKLPDQQLNDKLKIVAEDTDLETLFYASILNDQIEVTAGSRPSIIGEKISKIGYIEESIEQGQKGFFSFSLNVDEKLFFVVSNVYSKNKRLTGIFGSASSANEIIQRMVQSKLLKYKIHFALLSRDNIVFASSDPDFDLLRLKPLSPQREEEIREGKEIGALITKKADIIFHPVPDLPGAFQWEWNGTHRIGTNIPIENLSLSLLVYADQEEIFKQQYDYLFRFILMFCSIVAITGALTFWMTRQMARPLQSLRWVMQRIGLGDYSARFMADKMGYEINEIGQTLNEMVDQLLSHMEAVKTERLEKETLANELKIGRSIQFSILPQEMPIFPEVDLAAGALPAKEVSGDFYDFYIYTDQKDPKRKKLAITIADAAGKGISACLYSFCLRSMLRSYFAEYDDVGKVTRLANNLFYLDTEKSSMFVTAFLGIFDPVNKEFHYLSAGHLPAILRRQDGRLEELASGHMALGVLELDGLVHKKAILESGDLLVIYTDGVVEAFNSKNEQYGNARLIHIINENANEPVSQIWGNIVADVMAFAEDELQHDDITLIVMRVV